MIQTQRSKHNQTIVLINNIKKKKRNTSKHIYIFKSTLLCLQTQDNIESFHTTDTGRENGRS